MSLQKPKSLRVATASNPYYAATGRNVQVPGGGIHDWAKAEQRDWYTELQNKRSSAWGLSLLGHKTGVL